MKIKRAVMMGVLLAAIAAIALPVIGLRARAASNSAEFKRLAAVPQQQAASDQSDRQAAVPSGNYSPDTLKALGIKRVPKELLKSASGKLVKKITSNPDAQSIPRPDDGKIQSPPSRKSGGAGPLAGQPVVLNEDGALSVALITTIGGRDTQFSEVALLADWDGREDCAADRATKIDDFSTVEPDIDFTLTKAAISEHTRGNGHPFFNIYYYGDSIGNTYIGLDSTGNSLVDAVLEINLPDLVNTNASNGFTLLNPTTGDCADDQMTVTGIAVNPVADLGDFGLCGVVGEIIYVSVHDSQGCAGNAANQPIRTRIFAFGLFEFSDPMGGFVAFTNVRQILRSQFGNVAGVAVDDDGSLYFHLADLVQFTGAAIFKATEVPRAAGENGVCATPGRINRVIPLIATPPTLGSAATPGTALSVTGSRLTNYSGNATTFGNVTAIATGACNTLYAAVSASFQPGAVSFEQLTQGLFTNPAALGATPSMIISFADCSGTFDICSTGPAVGFIGGVIPLGDGFADGGSFDVSRIPGVNNFRVFVLGNGPDIRPAAGQTSLIVTAGTLKVDMQIDFTLHSGIAVNEEGTVFVISGGTPAGIGKNPSPMLTEILCFEDMCPMDRRADFVDLRGDVGPNPPASGGNLGDGDSDRFDHIFHQAPIDQVTLTPTGLSGLARGFLRYTNRIVGTNGNIRPIGPGVTLGTTKPVQNDDDTDGPITFTDLDPSLQVSGGDDQNFPNRGDDSGTVVAPDVLCAPGDNVALLGGTPAFGGGRVGGFEFVFGPPAPAGNFSNGVCTQPGNDTRVCTWNAFFLNSNGNITFGVGNTDPTPTVPELRSGPPRIAPAWADLDPGTRTTSPGGPFFNTFPVQALGFANINAVRVRWINVPEFIDRDADPFNDSPACGSSNTFSVTFYDDGTGFDENTTESFGAVAVIGDNNDNGPVIFDRQEGPTDLRFVREPNTGVIVGCPPRPEGSGHFIFEYCRTDLFGTPDRPVLVGFSIGGTSPFNPPGLCEINLSTAATAADTAPFGVISDNPIGAIQGVTASIMPCLIGEGTEPHLFELFNEASDTVIQPSGEVVIGTPDFDLRGEGFLAAFCTPNRQRDLNRGKVGFFGVGCAPPANPLCQTVVPGAFVTTPSTTGLINALCAVQASIVGCGFFPNETTIICQGFQSDTGVPLQRNGKTVSTAVTLACDTNGDGIVNATIALGAVTPVNKNLVRATFNPLAAFPGTAFPTACCGGAATLTVTTTFTAGDNNIFGPFTRTVVCPIALGVRAPVVFSVTPSDGNCGVPIQNLIVTGACFCLPNGTGGVTSAFAVEVGNPSNVIGALAVKNLSCFLVDAEFRFTSANAGKSFLIFLVGPGGTSRNLTTLPAGAPAGCPLGNEQGIQVTFTCNTTTPCTPGTPGCLPCVPGDPRLECSTPLDIAVVNGCRLNRSASGVFTLDVTGRNFKDNATVTVSGASPKKVKFKDSDIGTNTFNRLTLKGRLCRNLPGVIIVTNPGGRASLPFQCNERCPAN